jgi:hypothetical protein
MRFCAFLSALFRITSPLGYSDNKQIYDSRSRALFFMLLLHFQYCLNNKKKAKTRGKYKKTRASSKINNNILRKFAFDSLARVANKNLCAAVLAY